MHTVLIITAIVGLGFGLVNFFFGIWEMLHEKRVSGVGLMTILGSFIFILLGGHVLGWW